MSRQRSRLEILSEKQTVVITSIVKGKGVKVKVKGIREHVLLPVNNAEAFTKGEKVSFSLSPEKGTLAHFMRM